MPNAAKLQLNVGAAHIFQRFPFIKKLKAFCDFFSLNGFASWLLVSVVCGNVSLARVFWRQQVRGCFVLEKAVEIKPDLLVHLAPRFISW